MRGYLVNREGGKNGFYAGYCDILTKRYFLEKLSLRWYDVLFYSLQFARQIGKLLLFCENKNCDAKHIKIVKNAKTLALFTN